MSEGWRKEGGKERWRRERGENEGEVEMEGVRERICSCVFTWLLSSAALL